MRFRTDDVALHGDLVESATARPSFDRIDQLPTHTFSALAVRYHKSPNFGVPAHFKKFAFRPVNPADHFSCFGDEHSVFLQLKQTSEPLAHDVRFERVTELSAQLRDRRRIVCRGLSDLQRIHESTLSFCAPAFYTSVRRNVA